MEEVAKLFYGLAVIFSILMVVFVSFGGQGFWIAISASVLGVFGFGMYPLALELSVYYYTISACSSNRFIIVLRLSAHTQWTKALALQ